MQIKGVENFITYQYIAYKLSELYVTKNCKL